MAIEAVALEVCAPHIQSALLHASFADEKLVFDTFRIAQYLNHAADMVRRGEH